MRSSEILLLAIVFATSHLMAPLAWRYRRQAHAVISSFAGGLAMAYVCLHLIPEIDHASHLLGKRIYFLIMAGFSAYYGLEILVHRRARRADAQQDDLTLNLLLAGLYNFLLVYTLAQQLPVTSWLTGAFTLMIALHLVVIDFGLLELHDKAFMRRGRFVLVGAVLLGWAIAYAGEPDKVLVDVLTALLAGSMMYKVFRNELPEFRQAHYRAFLSGLGLFLAVHVALAGS